MNHLLSPAVAFSAVMLALSTALAADGPRYRDFVAPDTRQYDLLGNVKVLREKTSEIGKDGKEHLVSEMIQTFDPEGYLLEETEIDHDANTQTTTKRSYDASGNWIQEEERETGKSPRVTTIRLRPEQRRVIKEVPGVGGRMRISEETTYDNFRKEGYSRDYDLKGELESQYQTKRNSKGQETEVTFSDHNGKPETIITITWNEQGFITSEKYDMRGQKCVSLDTYSQSSVDPQGNWTEQRASKELTERGKKLDVTKEISTREIEYYETSQARSAGDISG